MRAFYSREEGAVGGEALASVLSARLSGEVFFAHLGRGRVTFNIMGSLLRQMMLPDLAPYAGSIISLLCLPMM